MSDVSDKMRLMLAAPHLAAAIEALLPIVRSKFEELSVVAMSSNDSDAAYQAAKCLEGIMMAQCALKEAGIVLGTESATPRLRLVSKMAQR